jgi:curved DNA-binding protein
MEFKDYYKVLGINADADSKQIKKAYRKMASKYHPDVSDQSNAEEKFKEVAEAYEALKDPVKRVEYDQLKKYGAQGRPFEPPPGWHPNYASGQTSHDGDFSEFFSSVFGNGFQQHGAQTHKEFSQRGQDIETELALFLEDTVKPTRRNISYTVGGSTKNLEVKIPVGMGNLERVRLKGQGSPGYGGAANGDLYLKIRLVPHPLFDVEGQDLILSVPLAPWEAALGKKIDVPTLSGHVHLTVPANSQAGQRLRVKNKGLVNKLGKHGDLYAVIKIAMPPFVDEDTKQYWKDLATKADFNPRPQWSTAL